MSLRQCINFDTLFFIITICKFKLESSEHEWWVFGGVRMIEIISDKRETNLTKLVSDLMGSPRKNLEFDSYRLDITIMRSRFWWNNMIENFGNSKFGIAKNINFGIDPWFKGMNLRMGIEPRFTLFSEFTHCSIVFVERNDFFSVSVYCILRFTIKQIFEITQSFFWFCNNHQTISIFIQSVNQSCFYKAPSIR